jgi:PadR family transcriptional regulator, regulatory protein AphA
MTKENKTRFALLGILSMEPSSGYNIKKIMEKSTNHFWREGDSSIYPILKKLLKEKKITCEIINENNKSKKIYTITPKGETELQNWLMNDNTQISHRNELLLKVFFGWNVQPKMTIQLLEKFRDHAKTMHQKYLSIATEMNRKKMDRYHLYPYLTLQYGVHSAEAALKWCDETIKLLKK